MENIQNLNLENILGTKGAQTIQCGIVTTDRFGNQGSTSATFTVQDGQVTGSSGQPGFINYANANGDASAAGRCNHTYTDGSLITYTGSVQSVESSNTGIYEFEALGFTFAAFAITLIIIMRGIWLAKRTVKATVEETNEDDAIEWYEDEHGRERWRLKYHIKQRMQ